MNQDILEEFYHYERGFDAIDWQHYQHHDMWNMIMAADPEAMFDEATKANDLATAMGGITEFLHALAQDVVGAWSGKTAENAAAQIKAFLQWSDDTANTVTGVAGLLCTYAHIVNQARLNLPAPDGTAASKTHAEQVMEHYATQSQQVSDQLGQHRFSAPPGVRDLPLPAPEPAAPAPAAHPTAHPTTHETPLPPTLPSSITTTPSSVTAMPTTSGGVGSVTGLPGGGAIPGGGITGGAAPGPGAMSGVEAMTAEGMAPLAAAMAEQAGWTGFAPMTPMGRPAGDRDGEHRDRYAVRADLIGELPPAFPPVLGL